MILNRLKLDWKYAIGEISLIAVGVLVALTVDAWQDYRADRRLEQEYIVRIAGDLKSALDDWRVHTGRLAILRDVDLRDVLSGLYTSYANLSEMTVPLADQSYARINQSTFPHEVVYAADMLSKFDATVIRAAFEKLRSEPGFTEASNAQMIGHYGNIRFLGIYAKRADRLLARVQAQIDAD